MYTRAMNCLRAIPALICTLTVVGCGSQSTDQQSGSAPQAMLDRVADARANALYICDETSTPLDTAPATYQGIGDLLVDASKQFGDDPEVKAAVRDSVKNMRLCDKPEAQTQADRVERAADGAQ